MGLLQIKGMKVLEGLSMSIVAVGDVYREGWLLLVGKEAAVLVRAGSLDEEWDSIQLILNKNDAM